MQEFPKTLDEAVEIIILGLDEKSKNLLESISSELELAGLDVWGMGIRNAFGLWQGNYELMKSCGCDHADDASYVIIKKVWGKIRNKT